MIVIRGTALGEVMEILYTYTSVAHVPIKGLLHGIEVIANPGDTRKDMYEKYRKAVMRWNLERHERECPHPQGARHAA